MATDPNGPSYYKRGSIDVWDFIRDQGLNFHLGNAIKYICRQGHKGNYEDQLSDLNKAIHYLQNERDHLQYTRNREDLPRPTRDVFNESSESVSGFIPSQQFSDFGSENLSEKFDR